MLLSVCLLLFSVTQSLSDTVSYTTYDNTLGDPAPRQDPRIGYQPVKLSQPELRNDPQQLDSGRFRYVIESSLTGGPAILGQLELEVIEPLPADADLHITVHIENPHHSSLEIVAKGQCDQNGRFHTIFPGRRTSKVIVQIETDQPLDNPVISMQGQQITYAGQKRIMLLGDSITDGKFADDDIGYPKRLYELLTWNNYSVDFVGPFGDPPYEGHYQGAMKISDFYPQGTTYGAKGRMDVTGPMNNYRPHIVAIHLGTNDLHSETGITISPYTDGENFVNQTGEMAILIDHLLKWHNGVQGENVEAIIVSLIVPIKYRDSVMVDFNTEVARLVRDFQNGVITGEPEPVYVCDHYTRFREWPGLLERYYKDLMFDSLHPNTFGHRLMGDIYYKCFKRILSEETDWFSDKTWQADLAGSDHYWEHQGLAVADVTHDGRDDIYISRTASRNARAEESAHISADELPFTEHTAELNIADPGGSRGIVFVDIDGDGDFDLFNGNTNARNRLYENIDGELFQDITVEAGLANLNRVTTGVFAFDCEQDGDMDLYAVNSREQNELYINNGDGRFDLRDRGANDATEPDIPSLSAAAADYDLDGDIDIYIVKRYSPNVLFVNNGAGYFEDNAASAGVDVDAKCNGAVWAELNNDGFLDLVVSTSAYHNDDSPLLRVYENSGNGSFQDKTRTVNIPMSGYSPLIADFDNDGDQDIITTNEADYGQVYRNSGNWQFTRREETGAEIHGGDPRGGAVFDYDNDGDVDFLAARKDIFNVFKQNNLSNSNHYLNVCANGPGGTRGGFGTKIWIFPAGQLGESAELLGYREIIAAQGHISQNSPVQHFGLGSYAQFDMIARFTDGTFLVRRQVPADQTIKISPKLSGGQSGNPEQILTHSGDQQSGQVGTQLPEPLVVKVEDENGQPVAGADVSFTVTDGDAELFLPESPQAAFSVEWESGQLENDAQWYYDETASGQGFVAVPHFWDGSGAAQKQVDGITADDYTGWIRVESRETATLDLKIDNESQFSVTVPGNDGWQWVQLPNTVSQQKSLGSGSHTFRVTWSGSGLHIDKLFFTPDHSYTPTGVEETEEVQETTDRSGLARRFVQLGQQAGPVSVDASLYVNGSPVQGSPVSFRLTATPAEAVKLQQTSGNNQTGKPDIPLAQPFVVTLYDAFDNRVPDIEVNFQVLTGGGTLSTDSLVRTDDNGQARTTLTPGETSSLQKVSASVDGVSGSPVIFTSTITGVAHEMVFLSGDGQAGTVMQSLPEPIKVQVFTQDGNPAVQYGVDFYTTTPGGLLSPTSHFDIENADSSITVHTNSDGEAEVYWRLGTESGGQSLVINAGSLIGSPVTVTANARHSSPAFLMLSSGDNQQGKILQTLDEPLKVRLRDAYGNGIPNYSVTFEAVYARGQFDGKPAKTVSTDSQGDASAGFTLNTEAGDHLMIAQAWATSGSDTIPGSPVEFYASVNPGEPAFAEKRADSLNGTVNQKCPEPFIVKIKDQYGNGVPEYNVNFTVLGEYGSFEGEKSRDVRTDEKGLAQVYLTFGEQAGSYVVQATCPGLSPRTLFFSAQASSADPYTIHLLSGNNQVGATNAELIEPFVVSVMDEFNNPIADHPVTFTVTSEEGTIKGANIYSTATDQQGLASAVMTLGSAMGDSIYHVKASSSYLGSDLHNSPVTFYASARVGEAHTLMADSPTSGLTGGANQPLPEPVAVQVTDEYGSPVANFPVAFQVTSGSGTLLPERSTQKTVNTNNKGRASVVWVLGELGENHQLHVSARRDGRELINSPITFSATAIETHAEHLVEMSGNHQTGLTNEPLEEPFTVIVTDEFNYPVSDYSVIFTIEKGDGHFVDTADDLLMTKTNSDGLAQADFILGQNTGENSYTISATAFNQQGTQLEGSPVRFFVSAEQGDAAPDKLELLSGNQQSGTVNQQAAVPLVTRIVDRFGQPVAHIDVRYTIPKGTGTFIGDSNIYTDDDGLAAARFRFGKQSGTVKIRAQAAALDTFVTFQLTALPDEPAQLNLVSGNDQTGIAGHTLNHLLVVKVSDQFENGVSGAEVTFSPQDSAAKILPSTKIKSDSGGKVTGQWILAPRSGEQKVVASHRGIDSTLVFTALALPNNPPRFNMPDSFVVQENEPLEFFVNVSDPENDSIDVSIENMPDGALFLPDSLHFMWTPGQNQTGTFEIILVATDHIGASRSRLISIIVRDTNHPPQISLEYSVPREHQLGKLKKPGYIDFAVYATDPDGDKLNYLWLVNDEAKATSITFRLQSQFLSNGSTEIKSLVYDQQDTASISWYVDIVTMVKLAYFKGSYQPFKGNELKWATHNEIDNRGFYVLRAEKSEGPFAPVSPLIPGNKEGKYSYIDSEIDDNKKYFYKLSDVQFDGQQHEHSAIELSPPMPDQFALHQNYPNPFNPSTTILFEVPERSRVSLVVYDILGQHVASLIDRQMKPGYHKTTWNGKNQQHVSVASGIYYFVLQTKAGRFSRKAVLLH